MVTAFPKSLIKNRWTKAACRTHTLPHTGSANVTSVQIARYGELMSIAANLCHTASYTAESFADTRDTLLQMKLETEGKRTRDNHCNAVPDFVDGLHPNVVRDPVVCRTKGTKSKATKDKQTDEQHKRGGGKCTLCGITGHNKRTCDLSTQGNGVGQGSTAKKLSTLIQILVWGRDHLPNQKHVFKPAMLLLIEISGRILPPLT
ncbi:hypothetical protein M0R45_018397 [Rubus argutus]|uniref:Uncharacterized protein n=1 Tax=Rubus argutus TaxID=59490 RepID=A0AAW1X2B6_RUBAR